MLDLKTILTYAILGGKIVYDLSKKAESINASQPDFGRVALSQLLNDVQKGNCKLEFRHLSTITKVEAIELFNISYKILIKNPI